MNKWIKIGIVVVIVIVALNLAKNLIVQVVFQSVVSKAAHVPVSVGSTNLSLLKSSITLKDLRVLNPRGFPERQMLHAPLIAIDCDVPSLWKGTAHFQKARIDLKEIVVIKNKDGKLNVDAVKPTPAETEKAKSSKKQAKASGPATKLKIDTLILSIGRVVYKDYSLGGAPQVQSFDINITDRVYTNIDNPTALVSLIMFEALTKTSLASLANLDLTMFQEGGAKALVKGFDVLNQGAGAAEDTVSGLMGLLN